MTDTDRRPHPHPYAKTDHTSLPDAQCTWSHSSTHPSASPYPYPNGAKPAASRSENMNGSVNGTQLSAYSTTPRNGANDRPSLPSVRDLLHPTNSDGPTFLPQSCRTTSPSSTRPGDGWVDRHGSTYPPLYQDPECQVRRPRNPAGLQTDPSHHAASASFKPYSTPTLSSAVHNPSYMTSNQQTSLHPVGHSDPRSRPTSSQAELPQAGSPYPKDPRPVNAPSRTPSDAPYMGQEFRPDEGLVHVYADGSTCKASIAGEPVNPQWGVTKAGKPRKRLAQACTTCREKKIKCEPGYPKCSQCTKMDRPCIRSDADSIHPDALHGVVDAKRTAVPRSAEPPRPHLSKENGAVRKREPSPEQRELPPQGQPSMGPPPLISRDPGHPPKRYRSQLQDQAQPELHREGSSRTTNPELSNEMPLDFDWSVDPYLVDPDLTMRLLNLYFVYRDHGCYKLFPRTEFTAWVENDKQKSEDDRMLLYMVLAVGSMFSEVQAEKFKGKQFANIARAAQKERFGTFSLQIANTRFFLMFYSFARQKMADAWEFAGGACRALSALRFNVDEGIEEFPENCTEYLYGMNRVQMEDCRRRTFWIGYTIDRYISFCSNQVGAINDADIFVRLPLPEANFVKGVDAPTDFFNGGLPTKTGHVYGSTAAMAMAAAIWGDVVATTYRVAQRRFEDYAAYIEDFYTRTHARLEEWEDLIPQHMRYSILNTEASVTNGCCSEYFVIHALHKVAAIALNRLGLYQRLSKEKVVHNIRQANTYSRQLLAIASKMESVPPSERSADVNSALLQPFPGYAVQIACDVVSRGGNGMQDLTSSIKLISGAANTVNAIGRIWAEARLQEERINQRLIDMTSCAMPSAHSPQSISSSRPWALPQAIQGSFVRKAHDLIHNTPADVYIEAIKGLITPEMPVYS